MNNSNSLPLLPPSNKYVLLEKVALIPSPQQHSCILCSVVEDNPKQILEHLFLAHNVVIADQDMIVDFPRYLWYWKQRVQSVAEKVTKGGDFVPPISNFATLIHTHPIPNSSPKTESDEGSGSSSVEKTKKPTKSTQQIVPYYLLGGGVLSEDNEIRKELQQYRLDQILRRQQFERTDNTFARQCLFCPAKYDGEGARVRLFYHMFQIHGFNIGLPDNLVDISELLDLFQSKLNALECLYCEKIFKSPPVLKLHMRKKKHFKISPKNKIYDRFYVINYLEMGKNWEAIQKEEDRDWKFQSSDTETLSETENSDNETSTHSATSAKDDQETWSDWEEDNDSVNGQTEEQTLCLFCKEYLPIPSLALEHAKIQHNFDFRGFQLQGRDFYACVKLINFIRRQRIEKKCVQCNDTFETEDDWISHLKNAVTHTSPLPSHPFWKDSQYLFPTIEDDPLLCGFEEDDWVEKKSSIEEDPLQKALQEEINQEREELINKFQGMGIAIDDLLKEPYSYPHSHPHFHSTSPNKTDSHYTHSKAEKDHILKTQKKT